MTLLSRIDIQEINLILNDRWKSSDQAYDTYIYLCSKSPNGSFLDN